MLAEGNDVMYVLNAAPVMVGVLPFDDAMGTALGVSIAPLPIDMKRLSTELVLDSVEAYPATPVGALYEFIVPPVVIGAVLTGPVAPSPLARSGSFL